MSTTTCLRVVLFFFAAFFSRPSPGAASLVEGTHRGSLLAEMDVRVGASNLGALTLQPLTTSSTVGELRRGVGESTPFSPSESFPLKTTGPSLGAAAPAWAPHTTTVAHRLVWLCALLVPGLVLCWTCTSWPPSLRAGPLTPASSRPRFSQSRRMEDESYMISSAQLRP